MGRKVPGGELWGGKREISDLYSRLIERKSPQMGTWGGDAATGTSQPKNDLSPHHKKLKSSANELRGSKANG